MLAINATEISKRYGTIMAVRDLSISVEAGEVLALLGPNGAGKTTTVELIEGLRRPDAGTIHLLGYDLRTQMKDVRERIGVQLQTTALYPRLTVQEVLELFRTFYVGATADSEELMDLLGLTEKANNLTRNLSGGQAQRLSVALALVNRPELVFLDEPTTGLDPQARRSLWDTIRSVQQRGTTVLLTTHYMEEAEQLCNRVAIMDSGTIIAEGPPNKLIDEHFKETAIELPAGDKNLEKELAHLPAVERIQTEGDNVTLYSSGTGLTLSALTSLAATSRTQIDALHVRRPTLEDVFLRLTGRHIRD